VVLTPGKIRGMDQLASDTGTICMVAVDHRSSMERLFVEVTGSAPPDEIKALKRSVCVTLASRVSAILLDADTAREAIRDNLIPRCTGLVCPLEADRPEDSDGLRLTIFDRGFGPRDAKCLGAVAVKLYLHYRPDVPRSAHHHKELLAQAVERCSDIDISLIVEPVPFRLADESEETFRERFPELVVETVRDLAPIGPDVLKIPYPGGRRPEEACNEIDQISTPIPWVLLGGAMSMDALHEAVQVAMSSHASGCIAGRSIWAAAVGVERSMRDRFLRDDASLKLERLNQVVESHGTPWRTRRFGAKTAV